MNVCFTINPNRTTEEFDSYVDFIVKNKIKAIEIFYPVNLCEDGFNKYTQNVRRLQQLGLEVVMHLPFGASENLCEEETYDTALQTLKNGIDYASQFDVHKYTLHLGTVNKERHLALLRCVGALKELCKHAYPNMIMIENMPVSIQMGYSPEEILNIIFLTGQDNLKFILDTGHAHVSEYQLEDYLNQLRPYLYHIHLNDNHGIRDEHRRMGEGTIDFESFFNLLKDYKELYCLEILYKNVDDLRLYHQDLRQFLNNDKRGVV